MLGGVNGPLIKTKSPSDAGFIVNWSYCNYTIRVHGKITPFVPDAPSLYPLKISENRKVFWCFKGVEKGCIRNKWVHICDALRKKVKLLQKYVRLTQTSQETELNGWCWTCKRHHFSDRKSFRHIYPMVPRHVFKI